ncbi:histidine phosphatase family protein [Mycobacterium sp. MYCO198283]|uniref:histidine phosphatase family protein n=1 Tax=Mycobacterium sp. MYCO198283 TaxID=2883505 RepID=UPI001E3000CE|nr:histidine phosphatase family protein [Mycobacterium sp. MYCO198283]MCG5431745.1 histidine phosphatase family protein [Mycobacterium sp. MYCO198283]
MAHGHRIAKLAAKLTAAAAAALVVGACSTPTPEDPTITVTFVRHAESEGNASGLINTAVPGPPLTPKGQQEAKALAQQLRGEDFDGVYASTMVRAQQTADPLARALGEQVTVLPGIQEIGAGIFEGDPVATAGPPYFLAPQAWVTGDRESKVPGGISGTQFNEEFTGAVQTVYDSGDKKPVIFSHGASIMTWTLMNVRNPKLSLYTTRPLPNTGRVVIEGNPVAGWTLKSWDGVTDFTE